MRGIVIPETILLSSWTAAQQEPVGEISFSDMSILASQALKKYLSYSGGPLNVPELSQLYFHLKTCGLRIPEYSMDDNFVGSILAIQSTFP